MKEYNQIQLVYINSLKEIAKGSKKYRHFVNLPLRAEAKKILKEMGFKGPHLS